MAAVVPKSSEASGAWTGSVGARPYSAATYVVSAIALALGAVLVPATPFAAMVVGALLCGWVEVDGACGVSHVSALTPLRALDERHVIWRRAIVAYTLSGLGTSFIVGGLLGIPAYLAGITDNGIRYGAVVVMAAIALLIARELRLVTFSLPEVDRQTQKMWAVEFGFTTGAAMWGAHIGLGFATVVKHGGLYIVAACALLLGPVKGAVLMGAFWLGRTLPVWITPLITSCDRDGDRLIDLVGRSGVALRYGAVAGLLCLAAALGTLWI